MQQDLLLAMLGFIGIVENGVADSTEDEAYSIWFPKMIDLNSILVLRCKGDKKFQKL